MWDHNPGRLLDKLGFAADQVEANFLDKSLGFGPASITWTNLELESSPVKEIFSANYMQADDKVFHQDETFLKSPIFDARNVFSLQD